jgi:hypothetical protein
VLVEQRGQHGGDGDRQRCALRFDQVEHEGGIERAHQHVGRLAVGNLERDLLTADVEERQRVDVDVAGDDPEAQCRGARDSGHAGMGESRALRRAGGARRVDDLGHVVGRDARQRASGIGAARECIQVVLCDRLAQVGELAADPGERCAQLVAPVLVGEHDPRGLRLAEHVRELARPEQWVHRHEHEPRQRSRVAAEQRLRRRAQRERDALSCREALCETTGE